VFTAESPTLAPHPPHPSSSALITQAALVVCEAESLLSDGQLDAVTVAQPEAQFIRAVGAAVRKQAEAMLREGMRGERRPIPEKGGALLP
jgi:hypothetical protein